MMRDVVSKGAEVAKDTVITLSLMPIFPGFHVLCEAENLMTLDPKTRSGYASPCVVLP